MNMMVFSVYDSKARCFSQPFYAANEDVAKRMFQNSVNDKSTMFNLHPEDYSLFHLGAFDDATGELIKSPQPLNLGLAANFKGVES